MNSLYNKSSASAELFVLLCVNERNIVDKSDFITDNPSLDFKWMLCNAADPSLDFELILCNVTYPSPDFECMLRNATYPSLDFECMLCNAADPSLDFECMLFVSTDLFRSQILIQILFQLGQKLFRCQIILVTHIFSVNQHGQILGHVSAFHCRDARCF